MCLIVVGLGATPRYPLIVAANRDEQHARPTASAAWWPERPRVLGGRDLEAGGTWLAVDRGGRFAAVTNIREADRPLGLRSRGSLVAEYRRRAPTSAEQLCGARRRATAPSSARSTCSLYDGRELWFASNRAAGGAARRGTALVQQCAGRRRVAEDRERARGRRAVAVAGGAARAAVRTARRARRSGSAEQRYQRTHFVVGPVYGTRCSTVVLVDAAGRATFAERSFDAAGRVVGEVRETFEIERPA